MLGAHEDEHAVEGFELQDAGQHIELVEPGDDAVVLIDGVDRLGVRLDADLDRIRQPRLGDPADSRGHGGGEERDLASGRGLLEDPVDILCEAHVEHLVGLVQDERLEHVQRERAALEMVHHAPGRADDDLRVAAQLAELQAVTLSAVDRQHEKALQMLGIALECLGDLQRKLACRSQNQDLGAALRRIDAAEQGQGKGRRLAGAGLGLTEQVTSGEQMRDALALNRRRGLVTKILDRFCNGGG